MARLLAPYVIVLFQVGSAGFALYAAVLWWRSAIITLPHKFVIHVVQPSQPPLGGHPLEGTYIGHAYSDDIQPARRAAPSTKQP